MVILTKQQFDSFMDVIEDQTFRAIFSALYWCGMRIGELLALNIRDYNKEDKTINIYKNYDFRNRVMTTTKTGATRIISVPDICIRLNYNFLNNTKNQKEVNTLSTIIYSVTLSQFRKLV